MSGRGNSGEIARNRLKMMLVLDTTSLSTGMLDMILGDIREVISRYAELDPYTIELQTHRCEGTEKGVLHFTVTVPVQKLIRLRNE